MAMSYLFDESTNLNAVWVKDSESCREFLVDLQTGERLLEKVNGVMVNPED